jgi:PAS domain-containing protein
MNTSKLRERGKGANLMDVVGFYSWNLDENKVFADHVFAEIYGIPSRDLEIGAPIEDVIKNVAEEDMQRVAKKLHETIISGNPCHQTYRISHPGGRSVMVTGQGRCLRNSEGLPSIYTGSVTAQEMGAMSTEVEALTSHCLEALKIAKRQRHALAERYLTSALGAIGQPREA